jgi:3-dehydroquinate synthase
MRTFRVELGPLAHPVHIGSGIIDESGRLIREAGGTIGGRAVIITDSNVAPLYAERVKKSLADASLNPVVLEVAAGEESKSLDMLATVFDRLAEARLDRSGIIVALGGGVIGDLAGFAASAYMRGVPIVQIPTTLTAQVDSALGGKTGVNLRAAKNLVGAFHQPRVIIADAATLMSLGEREFREGLAEIIKYAAIMDAPMAADLERDMAPILRRDSDNLESVVERSLRHKAFVVEHDERESGLRRILNFGHTIGHALETAAGYGAYLHGEAVAIGMAAAARLSSEFAGLDEMETDRLIELIESAGLPVFLPTDWHRDSFLAALSLDKKRSGNGIEFVLLDRLGHAITHRLNADEILSRLL